MDAHEIAKIETDLKLVGNAFVIIENGKMKRVDPMKVIIKNDVCSCAGIESCIYHIH